MGFHEGEKEVLVDANYNYPCFTWRIDSIYGVKRSSTIYLRSILRKTNIMYILGISAYYHDSAAVLIKDVYIVAVAQGVMFSGKKHDEGFPRMVA